ncbi:MAG: hypothetical protein H6582_12270 [Crocinitomicaceae bacterium]|nr:hypothetical protein [Crocinitomicaceae bacterium]
MTKSAVISGEVSFPKVWEICESEQEYKDLVFDLISGTQKALLQLHQEVPSYEIAHSLVNKCIYLGGEELVEKCKKMELHCRQNELTEAKALITEINEELLDIIQKYNH